MSSTSASSNAPLSDGSIGATQVPPTTDVLDAALLASDTELGLQARTPRSRGH